MWQASPLKDVDQQHTLITSSAIIADSLLC